MAAAAARHITDEIGAPIISHERMVAMMLMFMELRLREIGVDAFVAELDEVARQADWQTGEAQRFFTAFSIATGRT